jgi:hypothetical protein
VDDDGRKVTFVDYDGMFVPAFAGQPAPELGHPNYQHPGRTGNIFDASLDDFSYLSIQVSLQALSLDASLIGFCDDSLLFKRSDYVNPATSAAFARLELLSGCLSDLDRDVMEMKRLLSETPRETVVVTQPSRTTPPEPVSATGAWYATASRQATTSGGQSVVYPTLAPLTAPPRVTLAAIATTPPSDPSWLQKVFRRRALAEEAALRDLSDSTASLEWYLSEMVTIPAGEFLRGDEKDRIYLSEYRIGRTPVTVGMWFEYCVATKQPMPQ